MPFAGADITLDTVSRRRSEFEEKLKNFKIKCTIAHWERVSNGQYGNWVKSGTTGAVTN